MGAACCVAARPPEQTNESIAVESDWGEKLRGDERTNQGNRAQFQRAISLNNRSSRIANSWDSSYYARDHSAPHSVESSPMSTTVCESQWVNPLAIAESDVKSITTPSESALSPCLTEGSSKEGCSSVDPYIQIGTPESFSSSSNPVDCLPAHNKWQPDLRCTSHHQKASWRHPSMRTRSFFFRRSHHASSSHLSRQISDSRIHALNSLNSSSAGATDQRSSFKLSAGGTNTAVTSGASDWWSMQTFSDLVASSRREHFPGVNATSPDFGWTSARESMERGPLATERIRANSIHATPMSPDTESHTCGICSKLLSYHLCVVAVLVCGHVYHAECLEQTTSDANRHDPLCPMCNTREEKHSKQMPSPLEHFIKWKGAGFRAFRSQSQSSVRNKGSRFGIVTDEFIDPQFYSGEIHLSRNERPLAMNGRIEKDTPNKSIFRRHFSFRGKSKEEGTAEKGSTMPKRFQQIAESSTENDVSLHARKGGHGIF